MPARNKDLSVKLIINGEDRTGPAIGKTRAGLESISKGLERMRAQLGYILAANIGQVISGQIAEVVKTADAYKTLEARLKLVSDNTREYAAAERELFNIAQRTRGGLEATYNLYGRVETAVKALNGTQKDALGITETLNKAIALTSQGAAQDAAAIQQFSQALASGVLRGDEFNSVMENSPGLAQALADGLDVPITKLRGMAEAGELTADRLINALGKSAPKVAEQFNQLPVTVGQSLTLLNNEFIKFIGQSDKATGASATLAQGITLLSRNLDKVVDVGKLLAEIYGVKLAANLLKSAQASYAAAQAARAKAAADALAKTQALELLKVEAQVAALKTRSVAVAVQEAALYARLTAGTEKAAAAQKNLAAVTKELHAAQGKQSATQALLNQALASSATAATKSERAMAGLNNALNAFIAFEIGSTIGEWLLQFEQVRIAGSYVAEAFQLMLSGAQALVNGLSFDERLAQIKQIHADFDALRKQSTDQAIAQSQQVSQAEDAKAKAVEQAAVQQQQSFEKVKEATQALTAQLDADAKTQTAAIQQALAERLAAIEASTASDIEKTRQTLDAKTQAATAELQLQTQTAASKIALIDQEYAKELELSKNNKDRTAQLENEKRTAKLGVYTGLAEYYQSEITRLTQVYASEQQAAADSHRQLQSLAQNHQAALLDIERLGMDARSKLDAQESEFTANLYKIREEQAKGAQGNQEKINQLLQRNQQLNSEITAAAVNDAKNSSQLDTARYEAKDRLNVLYAFEKKALEDNEKAHKANADAAAKSLDDTKGKLDGLNGVIDAISGKLKEEMRLKIGVDEGALAEARNIIAELVKPAIKTIIIRTVKEEDAKAADLATLPQGVGNAGEAARLPTETVNGPAAPALPAPVLRIPTPNLPAGNIPPVSRNLNEIKFTSPNGEAVIGQFGGDDHQKLLKILKDSGAVTRNGAGA